VSALLEGIFNGLSTSSVLLIAALGLAIVFGLMGVINLVHGELMMLGAYSTYVVQNLFKTFGDPWFDFYILAALPVAFIVARCPTSPCSAVSGGVISGGDGQLG
jgi:urea transport system permease protein